MKSVLASVITLGLAASSAFAQLSINTPASAVVCQPLLINWSGGTPPYFLVILPGNQPQAQALVTFPSTNSTSLTWRVTIAAQTSLGFNLRDSTGAVAQSAPFSVQAGPDSSCVGQSSSVSFGSTAPPGATPSSSANGATSNTIPQSTSANSLTSAISRTSAGATPTSSTTAKAAGASRVTGQVAAAGIIGVAVVALLG